MRNLASVLFHLGGKGEEFACVLHEKGFQTFIFIYWSGFELNHPANEPNSSHLRQYVLDMYQLYIHKVSGFSFASF